jgi:peptide/nickel transport system substrate-binding protein
MKNPLNSLKEKRATNRSAAAGVAAPTSASEQLVFTPTPRRRLPSASQWRYLPRLLKGAERWILVVALFLVLVGLPTLGVRWYLRATEVVPEIGGSYTEALVGTPQFVNPILSPLSDVDSDLTNLIFSGLFQHAQDQSLQPDLITNYVLSEDEKTYTFFLRHDVKWHDGEALDADDVLFTIAAIQDPQYQSPLQSALAGVKTEKLDDHSFSLTLEEPFAPFLTTLTFGILPEHLWFNVPAANARLTELNIKPTGTGPFKFESLTKDKDGNIKSFTVVRNADYYERPPFLDEMTFQFYPDIQSALEALKSKKVEGLAFYPASEVDQVQKKNGKLERYSLRIPQYTAIFFNQKQSEVLQDDEVRRALATGVNRDTIISDALFGQGEPIFSAILPGFVGHNPEVEKYAFNQEEANKILREDGWEYPDGAKKKNKKLFEKLGLTFVEENGEQTSTEGAEEPADEATPVEGEAPAEGGAAAVPSIEADFIPREQDGVKLEFTVATVDLPEYQKTLEILQQHWAQVGVKVNVDTYSPEDIQSEIIKSRNYEALLFGEIVGNDPDPYPFWHSSQQDHPGLALAIFRDKEVDQLLDEARKTTDTEERTKKYLHFQNNIASSVPAIFLYNPHYSYAIHHKVQGVNRDQYITVPSDRLNGAQNWYIKTDRNRR